MEDHRWGEERKGWGDQERGSQLSCFVSVSEVGPRKAGCDCLVEVTVKCSQPKGWGGRGVDWRGLKAHPQWTTAPLGAVRHCTPPPSGAG